MVTVAEALNLALQHHQAGRLPEAESLCRQILQAQPTHPDALQLLGVIAHQVGRNDMAIDLLGRAIAANPTAAEAYYNLGLMLQKEGRPEEAQAQYREALRLKPGYADAWNNLGNILREQGRLDEAVGHYRQALAFNPAYAEAYNNLGIVLQDQGRLDEAVAAIRQALALKPAFAEAHSNLGNALKEHGRLQEAVAAYRQALAHQPTYAQAYNNLGVVFYNQGQLKEAIGHYRQALALDPACAEIYDNLGTALGGQGRLEEAEAVYRQALTLRPNDGTRIKLATLLPMILGSKQEVRSVRKKFDEQITALLNDDLAVQNPVRDVSQTNFYLAYQGCNDRDLQVKVARLYERACPSLLYRAPHCSSSARFRKDGKIRIGFISKFLRNHSIGKTTRGLLANLSRDTFNVCAIFVPPVANDKTADFIKEKADKTVVLPGSLSAARERIAAEELDILFYQDIGMDAFTYFLAFSRLAPVQCSSFGHPVTSGIRNIDYFISTENWEPENGDEHYSERLIRLKSPIAYYYKPAVPHPLKSRNQFGLADAEHIYICPQTLFKFHPDFDGILDGILRADPLARLVLVNGAEAHWTELLVQRFRHTMPQVAHRVTVLPPQPGSDFINLIAVSDVMLDTIHFCGFNTSLEAFAVGTPVVTWPGEFQRGRHTLAFYKDMGFLDCVADSPARYVELAVRLGTEPTFRDAIKQKILARNHVLYENRKVVTEYERVFLAALKASQAQTKKRALPGGGQKKRRTSGDQK